MFRKKVESTIIQLQLQDTVSLHGKVPNGWKRLYEADCFVFPSWYEGFSGALVEAMAVGIPIIASDIPMNMEAINSNTALIYPVKDTNQLVDQMIRVIEQYPQMTEMGKRAREEAAARFDIREIAAQYESFLKEVASGKVAEETLI